MSSEKSHVNKTAFLDNVRSISPEEGDVITAELIEQLRGGSQEAFKKIYLHYYDSLEKFLMSLLRSKEEAGEMAQDIFMSLWEKREQIDASKNIRNYIYTNARNAVINFFNHRKVFEKYNRMTDLPATDDITSENILIAREVELIVRLAVNRMPVTRRSVFELNHYKNMDNSQIADRLGMSKANVANHLTLARKDIKDILLLFIAFLTTVHL